MEEDRLQTDIGLAADIEESQLAQAAGSAPSEALPAVEDEGAPAVKQPRKRFVGRRTAAAAEAAKGAGDGTSTPDGQSGALQSTSDFTSSVAGIPKANIVV